MKLGKRMVREAKKEDLESILKLYKYLNTQDDYSASEDFQSTWNIIISNNDFFKYFVLEVNHEIVSTCTLTINPNLTRSCKPFAIIENVITSPNHRNKGYGKIIMKHAIDFAKVSNCYKVMLMSSNSRAQAHRFYDSLGFDSHSKKGFQVRFS